MQCDCGISKTVLESILMKGRSDRPRTTLRACAAAVRITLSDMLRAMKFHSIQSPTLNFLITYKIHPSLEAYAGHKKVPQRLRSGPSI